MSQRGVADFLAAGSGAAINKQMIRYRELLSTDRKVIKLLRKAEKLLNSRKNEISKKK
jgi:hypothetical protein